MLPNTTYRNFECRTVTYLYLLNVQILCMVLPSLRKPLPESLKSQVCWITYHTLIYTHKMPTRCNTSILMLLQDNLHVSGTFCTHHQEYKNCSWQPLVQHTVTYKKFFNKNMYGRGYFIIVKTGNRKLRLCGLL
jgi:hypothetical protein